MSVILNSSKLTSSFTRSPTNLYSFFLIIYFFLKVFVKGGTGKTFLLNTILSYVRQSGEIALATASSGIAATLLKLGRTAHSRFRLPIPPRKKRRDKNRNDRTKEEEKNLWVRGDATTSRMATLFMVEIHWQKTEDKNSKDSQPSRPLWGLGRCDKLQGLLSNQQNLSLGFVGLGGRLSEFSFSVNC